MDTPQGKIILIVDDNITNIKLLFNIFKEFGFKILIAKDGISTISTVQKILPDIILLDVIMPGIDGFETCRRLKASPITKNIPIIFMTALNDPVDKVKGLNLGAVDYITKPFQYDEVLARINIHLRLQDEIKERTIAENSLKKLTANLEKEIEKRTIELTKSLNTLHQLQIQLMHHEKMSSLGDLVSGIAHEINNPVNFIAGNIQYIEDYCQDLLKLLKLYEEIYPEPAEKIQEQIQEIDLEYLKEDLFQILISMKIGTDRLIHLSKSLRIFSRSDIAEMISCNIHEGIDSTLLMLKSRLKSNEYREEIKIIKNYGELPNIKCYLGQLNQVFMNLISNAIDAIDEKAANTYNNSPSKSTNNHIIISTKIEIENNQAVISIKDNGPGINPEIKEYIFERLFTTKPVGKGTGLGLSIGREIVEDKHQGKLKCISALGEGTEFIIEIPINL